MINGFTFEALASLAGQVIGAIGKPDTKGYANAVKDLHNPEGMLKVLEDRIRSIENDDTLSREKKETMKSEVIAQYLEDDLKHIQGCADVTDRDAENRGKLFITIFGGVLGGAAVYGLAKGATYYFQNYSGQLRIVPRYTR